jgi:hypothetical protein
MAVDAGAIYDRLIKRAGQSDDPLLRAAFLDALQLTTQDFNDKTNLGISIPTAYNEEIDVDEKYRPVFVYGTWMHVAENHEWNIDDNGPTLERRYRRALGSAQAHAFSDDPPLTRLQTSDDDLTGD